MFVILPSLVTSLLIKCVLKVSQQVPVVVGGGVGYQRVKFLEIFSHVIHSAPGSVSVYFEYRNRLADVLFSTSSVRIVIGRYYSFLSLHCDSPAPP